ncbi:MAG: cytochrome c oxidase subunit I+III, partial [Marinobacter maritimus]
QNLRRDIYGSDAVTGKVREVIHLPTNSWLPLLTAAVLAVVCVSLLVKVYLIALVAAVVALLLVLRWGWENGAHPRAAPVRADDPVDPPLHSRTCDGPGLWGMVISLMANGTLYVSLLFGWFYLWTAAPQWSTPETSPLALIPLAVSGALLALAVSIYRIAVSRLRKGNDGSLSLQLWAVSAIGLTHWCLLGWVLKTSSLQPTELAHDAVLAVALYYLLLHSGLAVIFTALQALRVKLGYVGARVPYEPIVIQAFWVYTLGVFWLSFAMFLLLPMAWGA